MPRGLDETVQVFASVDGRAVVERRTCPQIENDPPGYTITFTYRPEAGFMCDGVRRFEEESQDLGSLTRSELETLYRTIGEALASDDRPSADVPCPCGCSDGRFYPAADVP